MKHDIAQAQQSDAEIAKWALAHLTQIVAIDSASDERSPTIPSTPGQAELAASVGAFFAEYGATVETDSFANVIATLPGRGVGADQTPIALMVHLDTARGTAAVSQLHTLTSWDGSRVPYPSNRDLCVDADTYPDARAFLGHDIVHGPGDAPFGLDDKLGLTHLMTLARLLAANPNIDCPPVLLIGRPDEEVGRMEAVEGLAVSLAERQVDIGFTVDGILPYEINLENFNASHATLRFAGGATTPAGSAQRQLSVQVGGVNTHGCTAKAEGYRAATRLCAEIVEVLVQVGLAPTRVIPLTFRSAELRDCDATIEFALCGKTDDEVDEVEAAVREAVAAVVEPHVRRGASYRAAVVEGAIDTSHAEATWQLLDYVATLLDDDVDFPIAAEASDGHDGYSNPYRAYPDGDEMVLDVRIRDFSTDGLSRRQQHLKSLVDPSCTTIEITQQYVNMAPRLAHREELLLWPQIAATHSAIEARVMPIRGGTGVDPFLDAGVAIGNLGTGYFAPESEKEFTSLQFMVGHARWLLALVQVVAHTRAADPRLLDEERHFHA